ncbi:hypothetical protein SISNIDRAFT_464719 [Sistotremastrum niveocremeum HHB9708]|uniref:Uncharacterized protein n=1 Tax=Sistotremastrum niveocremeum HHB9708 TaxID=1314777 RepID=A0A164WHJ7_9AGAM|nr:hypothetical protein SISNIDRAFT_464719 [Sistotremastrum niveocremeum HHB9708]
MGARAFLAAEIQPDRVCGTGRGRFSRYKLCPCMGIRGWSEGFIYGRDDEKEAIEEREVHGISDRSERKESGSDRVLLSHAMMVYFWRRRSVRYRSEYGGGVYIAPRAPSLKAKGEIEEIVNRSSGWDRGSLLIYNERESVGSPGGIKGSTSGRIRIYKALDLMERDLLGRGTVDSFDRFSSGAIELCSNFD